MTAIVTAFKALPLETQSQTYEQITTAYNAGKDVRRLQLEAEIRSLGFKPGEGKRKPEQLNTSARMVTSGQVWALGVMASQAQGGGRGY